MMMIMMNGSKLGIQKYYVASFGPKVYEHVVKI
jgi:hypothetical protein